MTENIVSVLLLINVAVTKMPKKSREMLAAMLVKKNFKTAAKQLFLGTRSPQFSINMTKSAAKFF